MSALPLTEHARARVRQRAIPPQAVEALLAYGCGESTNTAASPFKTPSARGARTLTFLPGPAV